MKYCIECLPDRKLIQKIVVTDRRNIIHSGNKTKVFFDLMNNYDSSFGIVDEDPWSIQPKSMAYFRVKKDYPAHEFTVFYEDSRNNILIMIRPRLEEWIINASINEQIDLRRDYNLSNNGDELHDIINPNLHKFELLLDDLIPISDRIQKLMDNLRT